MPCGMQNEKELQNGGEIKELADTTDKLSKRLVKDTTAWTNKRETLAADAAACQQASHSHQIVLLGCQQAFPCMFIVTPTAEQ